MEIQDLLTCRVCNKSDNYANLFYNINRELLKNLDSLLVVEITASDGLSKWLCRDCAEIVEEFIKFRQKYEETSKEVRSQFKTIEMEAFEIEALDETFDAQSPLRSEPVVDDNILDLSSVTDSQTFKDETLDESEIEVMHKVCQPFQCSICHKIYLSQNSLNRHIKTTHDSVRHPCTLCSSLFTQKTSLIEHVRNLHKDHVGIEEVFKCTARPNCNRSFNTAKMLSQHLKHHDNRPDRKSLAKVSKSKKKYRKQCQICGLFFKHIEEHNLSHQAEKTFSCEHVGCGKTFKFKTSLDVHFRIHNNERNFECKTCHKKFRVSHHLKEHLSVHASEKTFQCEVALCKKRFSSKLNLYKHSKTHVDKKKQ